MTKRFSKEHVERVAREFAASHAADAWHYFGADVRAAFIDAHVMREMRTAHSADSTQTFTATEIVEFRDAFAERIASAEGVTPANTRAPKRRFQMES